MTASADGAEDWSGRVAVVTGAAHGIGFALAQRFREEGMEVVLADYDQDALGRAVDALGGDAHALGVRTDVSLVDDVEQLAQRARQRFGDVDVLVNNAGVNAYGFTTWETPAATWEWVFGVNLYGAINGIRSFLPAMIAAGKGHVVNTASGAALMGASNRSAYSASKHAVLGMSESLFYELAEIESPVRISVLIPGLVMTNIRDSPDRWPERLGENAALGPRATSASIPLTPEFGAHGPEVPARAVWDALQTGQFLINVSKTGLNALKTRALSILGYNPDPAGQTGVQRTGDPR